MTVQRVKLLPPFHNPDFSGARTAAAALDSMRPSTSLSNVRPAPSARGLANRQLISLRQRIRPRGSFLTAKMEIRGGSSVPHKELGVERRFLNQASETQLSTVRLSRRHPLANTCRPTGASRPIAELYAATGGPVAANLSARRSTAHATLAGLLATRGRPGRQSSAHSALSVAQNQSRAQSAPPARPSTRPGTIRASACPAAQRTRAPAGCRAGICSELRAARSSTSRSLDR